MDEITKICRGCDEELSLDSFTTVKPGKGDRHNKKSKCKKCCSKMNAERLAWRYHNEPGYKEKLRQKQSELPPEVRKNYRRREYKNNREDYLRRAAEWREKNRAERRQISHRYKVKRAAWELNGSFTQEQWNILLDVAGHKCLACGRMDRLLTQDHVVPLSKGGSNTIDNIQPLCGPCNSSKGTQSTDYRKG